MKKEKERAKERGGGGKWQRESERVREGWVRRLTAIDFSRQTRGLFVPLSILYPSTFLSISLSPVSPPSSIFLQLRIRVPLPSFSFSSLLQSSPSFLLSFARHASSSCSLANSRDIFPRIYSCRAYARTGTREYHRTIDVVVPHVSIRACKRSFLHPLPSVGYWREGRWHWFSHPVLPCIYHEDEGGGERERGRSRVGASFNRRWPRSKYYFRIVSGSVFYSASDSYPEYSVPELVRGWGWRAFLPPPPPPPPPLRNGGKRNDSLECLFSPMWILFFDSCSIGISVLPPPRGEGSLHPSTSHYTPGNGISSRASNYVEMVYSQSFGPFLSAGEKVLSVCQEGGCPRFQRNMVGRGC